MERGSLDLLKSLNCKDFANNISSTLSLDGLSSSSSSAPSSSILSA